MSGTGRRGFLAGSVAVLHSSLRAAAAPEVRTAFIGVGKRGTSLVEQVLEQANVRITSICDTDPAARDAAASLAKRDNPRLLTDYRKLLELRDFEAVFIATPCYLHAEMTAACLEAGKYVYCEKPLGITPEQVGLALRAARRAKTFVQVGRQLRYMPGLREVIRQMHEEKVLGELFAIKAQRHSTPVPPEAEQARPAWYKDVKRSGDLIVENAVHNIDVCNWVAGSRPVSAYGHGKKYFPKPQPAGTLMLDGFSVEYIYENDMHLDYSQLYLHPRALTELANGQWYIIYGEKGAVNLSKGVLYVHGVAQGRELIRPGADNTRENATAEFYACIREGRKPVADVTVGATAALTAILGREAIYRRRSVDWKDLGVNL